MRSASPLAHLFVFVLLLALPVPAVLAQTNLVENSHFHRDLVRWESVRAPTNTDFRYVAGMDVAAAIDSGAVEVTYTSAGPFIVSGISQCVPVEEGRSYTFGGSVRIRSGQPSTGAALMEFQWSTDPNCASVDPGAFQIGEYEVVGRWVEIAQLGFVEAPAGTRAARFSLQPTKTDGPGEFSVLYDDVFVREGCPGSTLGSGLCLNRNRFRVEVEWGTSAGLGDGQPVELTSDTGYFWFFDDANVELVVKVVDACALPGFETFWVFAAGLTDAQVTITVEDTLAGTTKTYENPLGRDFVPILDTGAFDTCAL